jgi:arginase
MSGALVVPFHLDERLPEPFWPPFPSDVLDRELPGGSSIDRMVALNRPVARAVGQGRSVVVCGDCVVPLAVLAGLQQRGLEPAVVWLDAHGDFHTPETTSSGYVGGMALAMAVGRGSRDLAAGIGLEPVPEERVVLVDARDLDPPEVDALRRSAVRMVDVEALNAPVLPDAPLYVHLDMDVIDPDEAPAMRFPAVGGPSLQAVKAALARLHGTDRVAAFSLGCTWDPHAPGATEAARVAAGLLAEPLVWDLQSGSGR